MKTYLDCRACFFRQGLEAARMVTQDEVKQRKVLNEIAKAIPKFPLGSTPPEMSITINKIVHQFTNSPDPYKKIKDKCNKISLKLYPELKRRVREADDPLLMAIKVAIAGNVIDLGVPGKFNIEKDLKSTLQQDFAVLDYTEFKKALEKADEIFYIADNAGEVVFDRVLIEQLNKKTIYATRGGPVLNDATIEDALFCGIDKIAKVISSGCDVAGTILSCCSDKFLNYYNKAKLIIAKGQGNYETLSEEKEPIFFLLKAKCPVIARDLGCKTGDIILKTNFKEEE